MKPTDFIALALAMSMVGCGTIDENNAASDEVELSSSTSAEKSESRNNLMSDDTPSAVVVTPYHDGPVPNCTGRTSAPSAAYGYVGATSTVTCTTTMSSIWVETTLSGNAGPYRSSRICNNTTSCSATASGPYVGGYWLSQGQGQAMNSIGHLWQGSWWGSTVAL